VVLGGGVACNQALVGEIRKRVADLGAEVYAPSVRLATDNAAMIARAGLFHAERGRRDDWSLNAYASKPLGR
jgi:N6-L-threonylcarbamoyladenine synthase